MSFYNPSEVKMESDNLSGDEASEVEVLQQESGMNSSFVNLTNFQQYAKPDVKIINFFQDSIQDKIDIFMEEYPTSENSPSLYNFVNNSDNAELAEQIYLRIAQSIINKWDMKSCQKSKQNLPEMTHELMDSFESVSTIDESDYVERLLQLIAPFWKDLSCRIEESNPIQHRNVCLVLSVALEKYPGFFGNRDRILMYLLKIVDECSNMEAVLYACFSVETLTWKQQISKEIIGKLRKTLQKYADSIAQHPVSTLSSANCDRTKYQVGQCARWLLDVALVDQKKTNQADDEDQDLPPVKLSPDGLSARCDQYEEYPTVCCTFPVTSGVYYYEATILTSGPMTIGWATWETDFNKGVGCDQFSIGIDGFNKVLFYGGSKVKLDRAWKEGDILGCLIDVPKGTFVFSLNGKKFDVRMPEVALSGQAYYAVAQLRPHQQAYFNFGQFGFKYPSRGIAYSDFHTDAGEQANKYQLLVPSQTDGSYWFKQEPTGDSGNQMKPFFRDDKQDQFDKWMIKLTCKIANDDLEESTVALGEEFKHLMDQDSEGQGLLRLIQSVIEELGNVIDESEIDIIVELIERFLNLLDANQRSLNPAKLLELAYPYMKLKSRCLCDKANLKHQNLCLILSLMRKFDPDEAQLFLANREVIRFLAQIVNECEHKPSQLFAVICLDNIGEESANVARKFQARLEEMARFLNKCSLDSLYTATFDYTRYQIAFCARWHLDRLAGVGHVAKQVASTKGDEKAKLDLKDMTPHMKISADRLCARSDTDWQSVSSVFPITSGVYFYEVILLTSGSMRIGWATKECEFEEGKSVGNDEYSIGYDGHQKKICHIYGDYTLLRKSVQKWEAGDVVGCLIDVAEKRFAFYLNGVQIEYQTEVFFSAQPYFAAVSLSAHQQAYFNFGQEEFKYPPADVGEYRDFYNATATNLCPFCSKVKAEYRFANCDHWTVCIDCLAQLKKCPTCNPTQESA